MLTRMTITRLKHARHLRARHLFNLYPITNLIRKLPHKNGPCIYAPLRNLGFKEDNQELQLCTYLGKAGDSILRTLSSEPQQ